MGTDPRYSTQDPETLLGVTIRFYKLAGPPGWTWAPPGQTLETFWNEGQLLIKGTFAWSMLWYSGQQEARAGARNWLKKRTADELNALRGK